MSRHEHQPRRGHDLPGHNVNVYLVGGAVRDALLGREVVERDWVVVGSTPDAMIEAGYRQVGRDFPVFLHPDTNEEYALARTERKTAPGHTGFVCHAGPEVTLEDDLRRRDLTVNAMAEDEHGVIIDPFGGQRDVADRWLRHVSDAFVEDPLRVFRVARFAAQLPGFRVVPETVELMRRMAEEGELAELAAERVWQELHKALSAEAPVRFFEVLAETAAVQPWFAELDGADVGFPLALDATPHLRFAALCWSLDTRSVSDLCRRLKAPRRFQQLGEHTARYGAVLAAWQEQSPETLLDALDVVGALGSQRDPEPVLRVAEVCGGVDLDGLRALDERLAGVTARQFQEQGLSGKALGLAIRDARLRQIDAALKA